MQLFLSLSPENSGCQDPVATAMALLWTSVQHMLMKAKCQEMKFMLLFLVVLSHCGAEDEGPRLSCKKMKMESPRGIWRGQQLPVVGDKSPYLSSLLKYISFALREKWAGVPWLLFQKCLIVPISKWWLDACWMYFHRKEGQSLLITGPFLASALGYFSLTFLW